MAERRQTGEKGRKILRVTREQSDHPIVTHILLGEQLIPPVFVLSIEPELPLSHDEFSLQKRLLLGMTQPWQSPIEKPRVKQGEVAGNAFPPIALPIHTVALLLHVGACSLACFGETPLSGVLSSASGSCTVFRL
jgi:hypothetical protein